MLIRPAPMKGYGLTSRPGGVQALGTALGLSIPGKYLGLSEIWGLSPLLGLSTVTSRTFLLIYGI